GDGESFGIHPALLDAALHPLALTADALRLPFAWTGITLHATNATRLRVHLAAASSGRVAIHATDPVGAPVISIESLVSRPVSVEQLAATPHRDSLFQIDWTELPLTA